MGITDGDGNDVSGNVGHIANQNPLRYRGYYYDKETGYYYLQSRYYDPTWGRFLNADDSEILKLTGNQLLGSNLFAYCFNNPVTDTDPNGYFVIRRWMVSTPIDILLMAVPGIGAAFAPIKSLAKAYGKAALKTKLKTPLASFIRFIARSASKIITGFQNIVRKIPLVGKWLASKIPMKKFINTIAGATSSVTLNKILNVLIPNIEMEYCPKMQFSQDSGNCIFFV